METLHTIQNYLKTNHEISPDVIVPETKLDDIGIDSISFLELIFEFESKFDIHVSDAEIDNIKTIGDLILIVDKCKPEKK